VITKKSLFLIALLFSTFFVLAQTPSAPKVGVYDCGLNYQRPLSTKVINAYLQETGIGTMPLNDGTYLVAGTSNSYPYLQKTAPNKGHNDYWVVKMDATGNVIWDKSYGGDFDDRLREIIKTADGNFILAGSSDSRKSFDKTEARRGAEDFWLVKIDANGNKIWDKTFGGTDEDVLRDIIPTQDGGFLIGGYSRSTVSVDKTSSKGGADYWLIKIDANGNKIWDKTFGGTDDDILNRIESTDDNNFILAGNSYSQIGGDKTMNVVGANDIWLLKINPSGNIIWQKQFGGWAFEAVGGIKRTYDRGFIIGCYSSSWKSGDKSDDQRAFDDFWVIRIDANGNKLWDKTYGGNWSDYVGDVYIDSEGNSIIAGYTDSEKSFDVSEGRIGDYSFDVWLVKLDKNGNKLWDKRLGSDGNDALSTISSDSDGDIQLVGTLGDDYWIHKFSECTESPKRSYCGDEDITLKATGCKGTVYWSNDDRIGAQITIHPTGNTTYWATCTIGFYTSAQSNKLTLEVIPNTQNLTNTANKNLYQSRDGITSNQIINSRVSYKAGNFIILGRGFKITALGVFEATIEGCRN